MDAARALRWVLICLEQRTWAARNRWVWSVPPKRRFYKPSCCCVGFLSQEPRSAVRQSRHLGTSYHGYWERLLHFMNNHSTFSSCGVSIAKYGKIVVYCIKHGNQTTLKFKMWSLMLKNASPISWSSLHTITPGSYYWVIWKYNMVTKSQWK